MLHILLNKKINTNVVNIRSRVVALPSKWCKEDYEPPVLLLLLRIAIFTVLYSTNFILILRFQVNSS